MKKYLFSFTLVFLSSMGLGQKQELIFGEELDRSDLNSLKGANKFNKYDLATSYSQKSLGIHDGKIYFVNTVNNSNVLNVFNLRLEHQKGFLINKLVGFYSSELVGAYNFSDRIVCIFIGKKDKEKNALDGIYLCEWVAEDMRFKDPILINKLEIKNNYQFSIKISENGKFMSILNYSDTFRKEINYSFQILDHSFENFYKNDNLEISCEKRYKFNDCVVSNEGRLYFTYTQKGLDCTSRGYECVNDYALLIEENKNARKISYIEDEAEIIGRLSFFSDETGIFLEKSWRKRGDRSITGIDMLNMNLEEYWCWEFDNDFVKPILRMETLTGEITSIANDKNILPNTVYNWNYDIKQKINYLEGTIFIVSKSIKRVCHGGVSSPGKIAPDRPSVYSKYEGDLIFLIFDKENKLILKQSFPRLLTEITTTGDVLCFEKNNSLKILFYETNPNVRKSTFKFLNNLVLSIITIDFADLSFKKKKVIDYNTKADNFEFRMSLGSGIEMNDGHILYSLGSSNNDRLFQIRY